MILLYLIVYVPTGIKATGAEAPEEPLERRLLKNKKCKKSCLPAGIPVEISFAALVAPSGLPRW